MSKTKRHKNTRVQKYGKLVDSEYVPQNHASKEYTKRGMEISNLSGRAYYGHHPSPGYARGTRGILRAKMKEETRKDLDDVLQFKSP